MVTSTSSTSISALSMQLDCSAEQLRGRHFLQWVPRPTTARNALRCIFLRQRRSTSHPRRRRMNATFRLFMPMEMPEPRKAIFPLFRLTGPMQLRLHVLTTVRMMDRRKVIIHSHCHRIHLSPALATCNDKDNSRLFVLDALSSGTQAMSL